MIFTIHFGVFSLFLETPIYTIHNLPPSLPAIPLQAPRGGRTVLPAAGSSSGHEADPWRSWRTETNIAYENPMKKVVTINGGISHGLCEKNRSVSSEMAILKMISFSRMVRYMIVSWRVGGIQASFFRGELSNFGGHYFLTYLLFSWHF